MFFTLNYHIINRAISDKIAISEEAFEQQLAYLREHGYTTLSLAQAIADIDGTQKAPSRSLLLTFDDGYADNAHVALPLLQACDMRATLFVITGYIGQSNRWNTRACYDAQHMNWNDLRHWHESGGPLRSRGPRGGATRGPAASFLRGRGSVRAPRPELRPNLCR